MANQLILTKKDIEKSLYNFASMIFGYDKVKETTEWFESNNELVIKGSIIVRTINRKQLNKLKEFVILEEITGAKYHNIEILVKIHK